jgi:hypothetical protein
MAHTTCLRFDTYGSIFEYDASGNAEINNISSAKRIEITNFAESGPSRYKHHDPANAVNGVTPTRGRCEPWNGCNDSDGLG